VRELILIAQDSTDHGHDPGMKGRAGASVRSDGLARCRYRLIRIMAYPGYVTDHLIETMAAHPQIVPYLDMPLQHAPSGHPAPHALPGEYRLGALAPAKMRGAMPGSGAADYFYRWLPW
jgi:ribosomal protein S12 methylthiotransferase